MPYERKQEKPQSVVQVDSKVMIHTIISSYYHYHKLHKYKELAYQKMPAYVFATLWGFEHDIVH